MSALVEVARLYYEAGMNQDDIAKKMGISRSYVSKLLFEAKSSGIVQISIHNPALTESEQERIIREHYHLRKVIVADSKVEDNSANVVAKRAADWLNEIVKNNDIIATGWGRTLYLLSKNLQKRDDLSGIKTVSLFGQQSVMRQNVYVTEGLTLMTNAFGATSYLLPAPVFLSSAKVKKAFLAEKSIATTMDLIQQANIAVFTIGSPKRSSFLDQPNGLNEQEISELLAKGAVADICLHILGRDGKLVDRKLDDRLVSIPLDELCKKDYRIAVVSGRYKMEAVYTVLEGGYINVLITDFDIAKELVERIRRKELS
ncbi:MAG: hypothetical protein K6A40_06545 [Solobacterium sp.]|nr:hypothetical protein [Solobacterium sp.]